MRKVNQVTRELEKTVMNLNSVVKALKLNSKVPSHAVVQEYLKYLQKDSSLMNNRKKNDFLKLTIDINNILPSLVHLYGIDLKLLHNS